MYVYACISVFVCQRTHIQLWWIESWRTSLLIGIHELTQAYRYTIVTDLVYEISDLRCLLVINILQKLYSELLMLFTSNYAINGNLIDSCLDDIINSISYEIRETIHSHLQIRAT